MPMKSYESFDAWMKDQSKKNQSIIKALRLFVNKEAPKLEEEVKWGNGCFIGKNNGVIYLYADKEWVQYGFFNGVSLHDPKKMLEGTSNYIRHIKVRSAADINPKYFGKLLKEAVKKEAESPNLPTKNRAIFEGLGKTALSALAEAKITTLKKLSSYTESEVLALHGLGPSSLSILKKILKAKNLSFKAIILSKPKLQKHPTMKKKTAKKTKTKLTKKIRKRVIKKKD